MASSHGLPRLKWVLALTTVFMVVEAVGGWVSGSLALLADAGHMLTDVGALSLSVLTAWIAQRPADDSKTYGYLRWEILAALVNGAALFGIATWVVIEAIQRIQHPQPVRTDLFLLVASAGLIVNLVSLWVLHANRHGSLNVRGAYLHVLGMLSAPSARSVPPRSSRSPAGPSLTRSSPSSCPSSSSSVAGGCFGTAARSCWSPFPDTSPWPKSSAACSACPAWRRCTTSMSGPLPAAWWR